MDLLTHAALGAAAAAALAPRARLRGAALAGALGGVLPDADILIASASDPLLNLEYHRHFSHSLAFVPAGAALAACLAWLMLGRRLAFGPVYLYAFAGYLLSPLLDACTSYGTHLLWPFSERPVAWSIVAVVDPLVTLVVAVPLLAALHWRHRGGARVAVAAVGAALALGALQHERAERLALQVATERGHLPQRLLVKPTLGNMVLWRSVYVHDERIHVDAVRVGWSSRVYAGQNAPRIDAGRDLGLPDGSRALADALRFERFADALLVRHPARPDLIGDARYAMLPTSLEPLWGVVVESGAPERAASFETARRLTPEVRQRFVDMLLGR